MEAIAAAARRSLGGVDPRRRPYRSRTTGGIDHPALDTRVSERVDACMKDLLGGDVDLVAEALLVPQPRRREA